MEYDFNPDEDILNIVNKFENYLINNTNTYFDIEDFEDIFDYYLDNEDINKLEQTISISENQYPNEISILIRKAIFLSLKKSFKEAIKILDKLLIQEPDNISILFTKARIFSETQKPKKAIELYNKILELDEESDEIYISIAREYKNLNYYKHSLKYYIKAAELNSENEITFLELLFLASDDVIIEATYKELLKFVDKYPFSKHAWHSLGMIFSSKNDLYNSIKAYDYALAIDENFIHCYLSKANTYIMNDDFENAIITYKEAIKYNGEKSLMYFFISQCYLDLKNLEDAKKYALKSIDEMNDFVDAWLLLSEIYELDDNYEKLYECANKAYKLEKDNYKSPYFMAKALIYQEKYKEAEAYFKKSLNIFEQDSEVWLNYSELFLIDSNNIDTAINILKKALKVSHLFDIDIILCRIGMYMYMKGSESEGDFYFNKITPHFDIKEEIFNYQPSLLKIHHLIDFLEYLENINKENNEEF